MKPLEGLIVLEFSQFLAGPSAGLKLADLGARVIKIERPVHGEACRGLSIKDLKVDRDSLLFHTINRNKESFAANLKDPEELAQVKELIAIADVITHNFRPGKMEAIGLGYVQCQAINPSIIYGVVSGYTDRGPWAVKPGQDLLVQSLSGLCYLTGTKEDDPTPFGISVADIMCGNHLTQGILAALLKRAKSGKGSLVEVSLLESILDVQFESLTSYLNNGKVMPERGAVAGSAHAYLSAPYGVYKTADSYIALAMGNLAALGILLGLDFIPYVKQGQEFSHRDEIRTLLSKKLSIDTTEHWITLFESQGIWCGKVLNYQEFYELKDEFELTQKINPADENSLLTTLSPIRINGERLYNSKSAPAVGAHNEIINHQLLGS